MLLAKKYVNIAIFDTQAVEKEQEDTANWFPESHFSEDSKMKLAKNKFALTCSFQKMIRTLPFRGLRKFDNSFYFQIFVE